jgi:hypothetical protein
VQPPQPGRLHAADLRQASYLLTGLTTVVVIPTGAAGATRAVVVPAGAAWTVVVPAGATRAVVPARAVPVPGALSVPVAAVAGLTVEEAVVVAAVPTPVEAPCRVPPLPGTPVVVRHGCHRHGLDDARRAHAGKSKTRGNGGRSCDSFDVYHVSLVPPGAIQPNV